MNETKMMPYREHKCNYVIDKESLIMRHYSEQQVKDALIEFHLDLGYGDNVYISEIIMKTHLDIVFKNSNFYIALDELAVFGGVIFE